MPSNQAMQIRVPASDGHELGASVWDAPGATATLLVHPATAVRADFYQDFADAMATRGFRVVTYDYRGIGRSAPTPARESTATMLDWAARDATAMHHFAESFGDAVVTLGHSFGGQLLGLVDETHRSAAVVAVAAQFGWYGHWRGLSRVRMATVWHLVVPTLLSVYGYWPGAWGLGNDLPPGVARQWRRWCMDPDYFISEFPEARARLDRFAGPLLAFSFSDDDLGPPAGVESFLDRLPRAAITHRHVVPESLGLLLLGHFGFFRKSARALWDETADFLTDKLQAGTGSGQDEPRDDWARAIEADLRYGVA